MNKERILNIAKALRESPNPDKFDMGQYVHPCGTPSCAFGHYVSRTDLQDRFSQHGTSNFWEGIDVIGGKQNISYADEIVLEHFDITESEADCLFSEADYAEDQVEGYEIPRSCFLSLTAKTANDAADWIEQFVSSRS